MFAVKGWNIDASALKAQTEPFKAAVVPKQDGEQKQSRKRKRETAEAEAAKNQDVGKMWEQHIEGKDPAKSKKQAKQERKKLKLTEDGGQQNSNALKTGKSTSAAQADENQADAGAAKKMKKDKKRERQQQERENGSPATKNQSKNATSKDVAVPTKPPPLPADGKLTAMQNKMRQKLTSARFRHLNQTLYTEHSAKALELFGSNPEMFEDYHSGFRQQVGIWPENPVDNFIASIRTRGKVRLQSQKHAFKSKKKHGNALEEPDMAAPAGKVDALPRTHGTCIIADLGCGDARLAQTLKSSNDGQNLQLRVHSYDLHSPSPLVTKADISKLPLADGSVDVAIFCLALMGTNWITFIEEAYRILHWKGELWIAEIKSRFGRVGRAGKPVEHSVGGKRKMAALKKVQEKKMKEQDEVKEDETLAVEVDGVETVNQETDVSAFVDVLRRRGFLLKNGDSSIDLSNKMFVKMEFIKAAAPTKGKNKVEEVKKEGGQQRFKKAKFLEEEKDEVTTDDEAKTLKPCLYKIR